MWTLHDVTDIIKQVVKWILIGLLGIIILVLIFKLIGAIHNALTPPPAPEVGYGKLPAVTFPQFTPESNVTYTIDTVTGQLPTYPDRLPVYKITQPNPTLQNLANARTKIKALGFIETAGQPLTETPISESKYQWTDGSIPPRTLTMDIDSYDFTLSTSLLSSSSPTLVSQSIDPTQAPAAVEEILTNMGLMTPDIQTDPTSSQSASLPRTQLVQTNDSGLVNADNSNAQAVRVDLFQKYVEIADKVDNTAGIERLPIYYSLPNQSPINALVLAVEPPTIALFSYHHQTISTDSSTYPIISTATAFEQLKSNNAYVAVHDANTNISIKTVELGYFMPDNRVDYLMPIYIFRGDATPDGQYLFTAYVAAVSAAYIQDK